MTNIFKQQQQKEAFHIFCTVNIFFLSRNYMGLTLIIKKKTAHQYLQ